METMKYPNVSGGSNMAVSAGGNAGGGVDEVDTLMFASSCWQNAGGGGGGGGGDYMDHHHHHHHLHHHHHKIILDADDTESKQAMTMDALDNLLLSQQPINTTSLAELKPLPPFTGYTANLSINGIQGHHYHAIAQRIPEENNNTPYNNNNYSNAGGGGEHCEQNIVSSSTCINVVSADSASSGAGSGGGDTKTSMYSVDEVVKLGGGYADDASVVSSAKMYDECGAQHHADSGGAAIKSEMGEYDISSIEDIAAIIGSAIADTTVPNAQPGGEEDASGSRDSWMDLDAWIDGACVDQHKSLIITQDGLSEFVIPASSNNEFSGSKGGAAAPQPQQAAPHPPPTSAAGSTLQSLLTHGYMPLLQNRLQNGPPIIKQEVPSSTNYNNDLISTSSPPSNVVSTTDNLMLTVNGRFLPQYGVHAGGGGAGSIDERMRSSPDMLGQNYPHTTTTTTPSAPKKSRSRAAQKKQQQQQQLQLQQQQQQQQQQAATSTVFQSEQSLGLLGKEKPVHRCNICNRGFLNKSNIKVHLRTHTGEKPFRCDTCAKAFRQKAHLLKHQQIHKRIGRD